MTTGHKTALVFGSTGAVGQELLKQLLDDPEYTKVIAFSRREPGMVHPKLKIFIDPLTNPLAIKDHVKGDVLFCCLGTTSKKAGSKEQFKKVDLELPAMLAKIAEENNIPGFIAISSIGAGKAGHGFYLNVKTAMEHAVRNTEIPTIVIVRPSLLIAKRSEFRFGEWLGIILNALFGWMLVGGLRKYRGIRASTVAGAMISIMKLERPQPVYESDELAIIGKNR